MTRLSSTISTSGPFFQRDPSKTFRANVKLMMDRVAEVGEQDVRNQLLVGQATRDPLGGDIVPERVSGHVHGRTKSLTGKRWAVTAVVSVQNKGFTAKQGIKLMAAASLLEGRTHAFAKTTARLQRVAKINTDELMRGIR